MDHWIGVDTVVWYVCHIMPVESMMKASIRRVLFTARTGDPTNVLPAGVPPAIVCQEVAEFWKGFTYETWTWPFCIRPSTPIVPLGDAAAPGLEIRVPPKLLHFPAVPET